MFWFQDTQFHFFDATISCLFLAVTGNVLKEGYFDALTLSHFISLLFLQTEAKCVASQYLLKHQQKWIWLFAGQKWKENNWS